MTFLRGLMLVAGKEFRHLRHDPFTLFLIFGVPLLAFLLFGYALDTRVHDVPTIVQNLDSGRYSRELLDDVFRSTVFRLSGPARSEEEMKDALRSGYAKVAIQIPEDYSNSAFYGRAVKLRVWVDGSDAILAGQAVYAMQSIALRHKVGIAVAGTATQTDSFELHPEILYNPQGRPANFFVPALCALLGETTTLLLVALSIAKEHERGTLDQLRITFIPLSALIAGKLVASAVMGLATAVGLIGLMQLVFHVPIAGNTWLLLFALVAIQGPTLGLGLILTAEARNQAQALQLTFLVILPEMLISGLAFPRETMAPAAAAISAFVPTTWSIQLVRGIVLRGATFGDLLPQFSALAMLTGLFLAVGTWCVRRRLS